MTGRRFRLPKRVWVTILVLVALALLAGTYFILTRENTDNQSHNPPSSMDGTEQEPSVDDSTITLLATGDWIAHDAINAQAKQSDGTYDYTSMTAGMKASFSQSDINFCNVATLAGGTKYGVSGYPIFNAPTSWIDAMDDLGCNLYNTGTNHTNDKGQAPITAELDYLDTLDGVLAHAGANRSAAEQNQVRYFEVKGVKFAFVSYSTYSNSPNPNPYSLNRFDDALVTKQMGEAREQADIVIVSMRWGTEYSSGINALQETSAQRLADLGADIVLGHGQHVLGPVKRLSGLEGREAIVWYGLGNFLNSQLETEALTGCVAQFDIDTATKQITHNSCLPFYQHYEWTAEEKAKEDLLARKNFQILPLYDATEFMAKSQLQTTVEEQMERIRRIINQFTEVPVQNASDL